MIMSVVPLAGCSKISRRLSGGGDGHLESRVDALAEELEQVKAQLAETHERLDFTERLLAQGRHSDQLPGS